MRTTLDIDDDVLAAVKELARRERAAVGRVLSRLARQALIGETAGARTDDAQEVVAGFRPFPPRGVVVTNDLIDQLRDREGL